MIKKSIIILLFAFCVKVNATSIATLSGLSTALESSASSLPGAASLISLTEPSYIPLLPIGASVTSSSGLPASSTTASSLSSLPVDASSTSLSSAPSLILPDLSPSLSLP